MKAKIAEWFLILIFVVPVVKLIMDEFTFTGNATHPAGMIANVTACATAAGFSGDFEFALWKLFPIILLFAVAVGLFFLFRRRREEGGEWTGMQ